jgi:flavodoxin
MKTLICYVSTHHGNTLKVANAINDVVKGELVDLDRANPSTVKFEGYDLIGLGSGVYRFTMSEKLFALVNKTDLKNRKVFLFATSASGQSRWFKQMKSKLAERQAIVVGEFMCPGFIDWAFFKWFGGGLRKGQPNAADLENARTFAKSLISP